MNESYLQHYGVKGMKWGVRRAEKRQAKAERRAERKKQKAQKKFRHNVNRGWIGAYNKATDEFNSKIDAVNKKYSGTNLNKPAKNSKERKRNREYIQEVGKLWTDSYSKALIDGFGPEPISNGKDWVKNMPFMDTYSSLLDEYDRYGFLA